MQRQQHAQRQHTQLSHCLGYEVKSGVEPSCTSSCDGDVITACGEDFDIAPGDAIQIDCGKFGLTCDPAHLCVDAGATACENPDEGQCRDGERPLLCSGSITRQGPDCSALGLGCMAGQCQGTGATCTNQVFPLPELVSYEGVSCNGGTLEACVNGQLESVACATLGPGFDCQSVGESTFCGLASECLPAGDGAASESDPPSCDGTSLTFCNAGRLDTIDCTSLGFTGCTIDRSQSMYGCTPTLAP